MISNWLLVQEWVSCITGTFVSVKIALKIRTTFFFVHKVWSETKIYLVNSIFSHLYSFKPMKILTIHLTIYIYICKVTSRSLISLANLCTFVCNLQFLYFPILSIHCQSKISIDMEKRLLGMVIRYFS